MVQKMKETRSLEKYAPHEIKNYSKGNRIEVAIDKKHIRSFVENAIVGNNKGKKLLLGKISNYLAEKIKRESKADINLDGFNLELRADDIKHLFKEHGNADVEALRGQLAVTIDDILSFADIVSSFDSVTATSGNGLKFVKTTDEKITAITLYAAGNKSLSLKTMWVNKKET